MTDIAIQAKGLSKQYRIGKKEPYRTLRGVITSAATAPYRGLQKAWRPPVNEHVNNNRFWALEDLDFEIKHGDVVGVIGRNGAGKSTLLKILSRITEPTRGHADVCGRVGSLLEVGTGFHPELTGRENIYLNGAIIGMRNAEIKRKIDEIVAFSEVEKFIDTPIKHFSSGMYLRLAFSVAAHLEPEILLIDEVLAVGDLAFQRKCLGKMEETASTGRTIIFVSHNLGMVKELCKTGLVIEKGKLSFQGPIVQALAQYSKSLIGAENDVTVTDTGWRGILVNDQPHDVSVAVESGEPLVVDGLLNLHTDFSGGPMFCILTDSVGDVVVHQRIDMNELARASKLEAGRYRVRVQLPPLWMAPGVYTVYFKFLGRRLSGREERHFSERVILDIQGHSTGASNAHLTPPMDWTLVPEVSIPVPVLAEKREIAI